MSLVTMTEIADSLGVSKQALSNRKRRHDDVPFPQPIDYVVRGIAQAARYHAEEVERWYEATKSAPRKCRCACHKTNREDTDNE